ncbi:MAG TPA: ABC transporter permease, partial [Actinotalea sp.]|nr:ABC transporter permease [Actinotalea sp.]
MSGTLARWRVAARIARRDARRNRARTALVAVLVGLPVLLGSAGSGVILSSYGTDARQMEGMLGEEAQALGGAAVAEGMVQDLLGTSASWSTDGPADVDLASFEEQLREALPAADALSRSVTVEASLVSASHRTPPSAHVTSLPDVTVPGRFPVASGALPTAAGEVALSHAYADRLGVGVGDSVSMELADGSATRLGGTGILGRTALGPPAVVAPGSLEAPAGAFPAGRVTTPAALTSVAWYVVGPEAVTWEQVLAVNELGAPVTSRSVVLDPPPRSAVPYYAGGGGASVDTRAVAVAGLVGGLVVLEAVLLIGPAFAVAARRSQRQLAVLAAVGADRRTMRASVLLVGSVTGLAASVVGVVGGVVIGAVVRWVVRLRSPFAMPDMRLSVWLLLALVAFGLVVTTLAAWLPPRRASRVDGVAAPGGRRADAAP